MQEIREILGKNVVLLVFVVSRVFQTLAPKQSHVIASLVPFAKFYVTAGSAVLWREMVHTGLGGKNAHL